MAAGFWRLAAGCPEQSDDSQRDGKRDMELLAASC
jgi:hypothetical protein